jgi:hypothetical protein
MKIIIAGFLIGLGIAIAGLANRYQIEAFYSDNFAGGVVWKVDGLTGSIVVCDRSGCMRVDRRPDDSR